MRKPKGHIRKRPFGYEIAVPEGRDPITKRYQYRYEYAHSEEEAEAARERMPTWRRGGSPGPRRRSASCSTRCLRSPT